MLAEDLATRIALAVDNARLLRETQQQVEHQATLNAALRVSVEERDRALAELEAALKTRDDFLASASHDLKSPLASIKGTAQLLQRRLEQGTEPDLQRLSDGLGRVDAIATRAAGVVDELLDITRMQMGQRLDLERRAVDLVELAREAIGEHQQASDRHTLELHADQPELVGMWDPRRLARVLSNLLDNAIKYSPNGGPVDVRVGQDDDWAVVSVADHGIGIPPAELDRVFQRFQRGSNVGGRISGTGIGLASARHIVESHGGSISVTSEEGAGATFVVRLPRSSAVGES
jgi:signal transduction histidine kinase